jgi:septal ring factor EnvC (AmiA/AmiB activator)
MDPDILSGIAGVLGVMIPVMALSIGGLLVLSRSRIGEAVARRIAGDSHHPECESQIAALQDQVDGLQSQLNDTQERLDFAERLLTRVEETRRGITHGDA